jgi:hypothetical protein
VCLSSMDMEHGNTNAMFTTVTIMTSTAKIRIICLIEANAQGHNGYHEGNNNKDKLRL